MSPGTRAKLGVGQGGEENEDYLLISILLLAFAESINCDSTRWLEKRGERRRKVRKVIKGLLQIVWVAFLLSVILEIVQILTMGNEELDPSQQHLPEKLGCMFLALATSRVYNRFYG